MGIFHKVTTNEEFVLNITAAATKRLCNATTSVNDNAFELDVRTIGWSKW